MANRKDICPECDSEEFVTELNQYEVYEFQDGDFVVTINHFIDEYKTFCRECLEEVDVEKSVKKKSVVLKT